MKDDILPVVSAGGDARRTWPCVGSPTANLSTRAMHRRRAVGISGGRTLLDTGAHTQYPVCVCTAAAQHYCDGRLELRQGGRVLADEHCLFGLITALYPRIESPQGPNRISREAKRISCGGTLRQPLGNVVRAGMLIGQLTVLCEDGGKTWPSSHAAVRRTSDGDVRVRRERHALHA